jgi:hypothetical protein
MLRWPGVREVCDPGPSGTPRRVRGRVHRRARGVVEPDEHRRDRERARRALPRRAGGRRAARVDRVRGRVRGDDPRRSYDRPLRRAQRRARVDRDLRARQRAAARAAGHRRGARAALHDRLRCRRRVRGGLRLDRVRGARAHGARTGDVRRDRARRRRTRDGRRAAARGPARLEGVLLVGSRRLARGARAGRGLQRWRWARRAARDDAAARAPRLARHRPARTDAHRIVRPQRRGRQLGRDAPDATSACRSEPPGSSAR